MGKWSCDSMGCEYEVDGTSGYLFLSFDNEINRHWIFQKRVKVTVILNSPDAEIEKRDSLPIPSMNLTIPKKEQASGKTNLPSGEIVGTCQSARASEKQGSSLPSVSLDSGDTSCDSFAVKYNIEDDMSGEDEAPCNSDNQVKTRWSDSKTFIQAKVKTEEKGTEKGRKRQQEQLTPVRNSRKPVLPKKFARMTARKSVPQQRSHSSTLHEGNRGAGKKFKPSGKVQQDPGISRKSQKKPAKVAVKKGYSGSRGLPAKAIKSTDPVSADELVIPKNYDGSFQVKDGVYCEVCQSTFVNRFTYLKHKRNRTRNEKGPKFDCKLCDKKEQFNYGAFQTEAEQIVHTQIFHGSDADKKESAGKSEGEIPYNCPFCSQELSTHSQLVAHVKEHTGETKYQCCACAKFVENWPSHAKTHGHTPRFRCLQCNLNFHTRADLQEHQQTHTLNCNYCGMEFKSVTSRMLHIRSNHADRALKCPICDKVFNDLAAFKNHKKYHRYQKTKQCPVCGVTVHQYRMSAHMRRNHEQKEVKKYVCDKCPMQFNRPSDLKGHYRCHTGEKPYACDYCPKKFKLAGTLAVHIRTHTQEKKFVCEICGKRSNTSYNMKIHKRIHSSLQSFPCTLCGQAFKYKASLKGHMMSRHSVQLDAVSRPQSSISNEPHTQSSSESQTHSRGEVQAQSRSDTQSQTRSDTQSQARGESQAQSSNSGMYGPQDVQYIQSMPYYWHFG